MKIYRAQDYIVPGKHIHIFTARRTDRIPEELHKHDFIEIIYILEGSADQQIDERHYTARRGDLFFVNYGSTHAFLPQTELLYINICFSPELISQKILTPENAFSLLSLTAFHEMCQESDGARLSFLGKERQEIESILASMTEEYCKRETAWDRVMESYLNILLTKMLRKTEAGIQKEELNSMWQELAHYIDTNLGAELTLETLAKKCFYNTSYFSRIFKEKFRMPFVEYVTRARIDRAAELLRDTARSIEDIREQVGFSDHSSFYRAFSKYTGTTPAKYRISGEKVKNNEKSI